MPQLSHFIRERREEILSAWERFARKLPSAAYMDVTSLRDHAGAMLDAIAEDLETTQTERQRADKSQIVDSSASTPEVSAASKHGLGRAESGFRIEQMFAEFRALRASVIGLWREQVMHAGPDELEEITRFNEAIDQAIAESTARYVRAIEMARDRFFAILGHDLRTPLGVVLTSSQFLLETADLSDAERTLIAGIEKSGHRMIDLVKDLLELALTRLDGAMSLRLAQVNVADVLRDVASEVAASNSGHRIELEAHGALTGTWDAARLEQAFTNLVSNAVQHGAPDAPVRIEASGEGPDFVTVSIANEGPPIPANQIAGLFDPMKRNATRSDRRHLGLGLYIVHKIVDAHTGRIEVRSSEAEGTLFIVSLPRTPRDLSTRNE